MGIKINQKRKYDGATVLHLACKQGKLECVRLLLSTNSTLSNDPDSNGQTPFYIAASEGHPDIVYLLLQTGRIGNVQLKQGLGVARRNNHHAVVGLLINARSMR